MTSISRPGFGEFYQGNQIRTTPASEQQLRARKQDNLGFNKKGKMLGTKQNNISMTIQDHRHYKEGEEQIVNNLS